MSFDPHDFLKQQLKAHGIIWSKLNEKDAFAFIEKVLSLLPEHIIKDNTHSFWDIAKRLQEISDEQGIERNTKFSFYVLSNPHIFVKNGRQDEPTPKTSSPNGSRKKISFITAFHTR